MPPPNPLLHPPPTLLPISTPVPPDRYPNLETPTQLARTISRPRQFRRTASRQEDCHRVLTKTFGHPSFRGKQKEIMEAAIKGADVLVVMATGSGKSLCFQVPAVTDDHGITLVISPLLSLMKNQVEGLKRVGVKVWMLSSETGRDERGLIEKDLLSGHPSARLLYLTPETLFTPAFLRLLSTLITQGELRRLVIDEAHCISEWGSSFRPEYRKLGFFREKWPEVPIMALTASATKGVERDIVKNLGLSGEHLFRVVEPFNRHNLYYEVRYRPEPDSYRLEDISTYILSLHSHSPPDPLDPNKRRPVSGIIYCRARASCDAVSDFLRAKGIKARPYHKGLKGGRLDETLKEWLGGKVELVVATIAFGMGIDKPDVRYVIHFDLPKSFEGLYQETGRAGRDGHLSKCLLYYSREDAVRLRRLVEQEKGKKKAAEEVDSDDADVNRGVDSFKMVQHYAESTTTCRHVFICRYFGEKIDDTDREVTKLYCNGMCDVCRDPAKVARRALELTEEIQISSQIPTRPERDQEDRLPIHPVNFYGVPEAFAESSTSAISRPKTGNALPLLAPGTSRQMGPPISTSLARPSAHQGMRAQEGGVPARAPLSNKSLNEEEQRKEDDRKRKAAIIVEREPVQKKSKVVEASPYNQPASSYAAAGVRRVGLGSQQFKTPFLTTPAASNTSRQRGVKRPLSNTSSASSIELPIDEDELVPSMTFSQKIPVQLRSESLKSTAKALQKLMTEEAWTCVVDWSGHAKRLTDKQKGIVLVQVAKEVEFGIQSFCVTAEGYSDRVHIRLRLLQTGSAWHRFFSTGILEQDIDPDNEDETDARDILRTMTVMYTKQCEAHMQYELD